MQEAQQVRGEKQLSTGKWAGRFIWAAIVNGAFAVIWTVFIVWPGAVPSPSMVMASGSAGTWLFVGYSLYLILGVLGVAVTALFYFYIESLQRRFYSGYRNMLGLGHLALMEVGVTGSTWLMMYGGFVGGAALLSKGVGGGGLTSGQVHVQILQYYPEPILAFVLVAVVGVLLGGLGFVMSERGRWEDAKLH